MTLREFFVDQQAHARRLIREQRMAEAQTLPVLNTLLQALGEEPVEQLFGPTPDRARSSEITDEERKDLILLRHDASVMTNDAGEPIITDFTLVDEQLLRS
jgi:hypothetical protein